MQWSLLKIVLVCAANNRAPTLPSTICMQQSSACEKQWQTFAEGAVKPLPGILRSRRYYSNEPWPYVRRRPRSEWLCVSHDSWLRQAKKKKNDCQVLFHNLLLGRYYRYPKCMCTSTETVHFFHNMSKLNPSRPDLCNMSYSFGAIGSLKNLTLQL